MNMHKDMSPEISACRCTSGGLPQVVAPIQARAHTELTAETVRRGNAGPDERKGVRLGIMMSQAAHHSEQEAGLVKASEARLDTAKGSSIVAEEACDYGGFFNSCKRLFLHVLNVVGDSAPIRIFREGLERVKEYASSLKEQFCEWFNETFEATKAASRLRPLPLSSIDIGGDISIPRVVVSAQPEHVKGETARRGRRSGLRRRQRDEELECFFQEESEYETFAKVEDEQPQCDESASEKELSDARRRIREIDAQYGPTQNNPEVARILASLGTRYDALERAIEAVYSLQIEEIQGELRERSKATQGEGNR